MPAVSAQQIDRLLSRPSVPVWALKTLQRVADNRLTLLDRLWLDPSLVMSRAGIIPDEWQQALLAAFADKILVLCSRQVGKSTTVSALAVRKALIEAPALILVLTPSERQSAEFLLKVKQFYDCLARPQNLCGTVQTVHQKLIAEAGRDGAWESLPKKVRESSLQLHLDNGSRIIGLPASEATVRCYSGVSLVIWDEASRVPDDLRKAVRPMLSTSQGQEVALTTPFGKRGWFFDEWEGQFKRLRIKVPATQCPRISKKFLAEEARILGPRWFRQEYLCSFEDAIDSLFPQADVEAAFAGGQHLKPLWS